MSGRTLPDGTRIGAAGWCPHKRRGFEDCDACTEAIARAAMRAEVEPLVRDALSEIRKLRAQLAEVRRLAEAENNLLRSCLAPFAKYAESLPPVILNTHRDTDGSGVALSASVLDKDYQVTFGHFRAAAAALAVSPPRTSTDLSREVVAGHMDDDEYTEPCRGDAFEPKVDP